MTTTDGLICRDELRRDFVRRADQNGLDHVEVSDDHRTLTVSFLAKAPAGLGPGNIKITGGQQVTGITALAVRLCADDDPEIDDCIQVTVSQPGDASCYQLCLVEADAQGRPTDVPLAGMDPRYACVSFSFMVGCPTGLDCAAGPACPPPAVAEPDLSYLAKDYASFRQLLLDRLALITPAWTETHEPDIGMAIVELLSWVGDELSYYQDAVGTEAYLQTARQRISVRRHLTLIDYRLHDGCNARIWVCVELSGSEPVTLKQGDVRFITTPSPAASAGQPTVLQSGLSAANPGSYLVFEPVIPGDTVIYPAHSEIYFWTWGDGLCCLPAGATAATLVDAWTDEPSALVAPAERPRALQLAVGDVLIIEEIAGPLTGAAADADPRHRQAVRLTAVEPVVDPLFDQPVVNVQWSAADALTFPVCLSSLTSTDCVPVCPVSVARGNVILADHGMSLTACDGPPEILTVAQPTTSPGPCQGPYQPGPVATTQAPYEPALAQSPVTQSAPFPDQHAVARRQARALEVIPGAALAAVRSLLAGLASGPALTPPQVQWLTTLFGTAALVSVGLLPPTARPGSVPGASDQASAVAALLAQQEILLDGKLRRLRTLARRARNGLLLGSEVIAEIGAGWGSAFTAGLDPADPALFGPATDAISQDPRAALPAVTVWPAGPGPEPLPTGTASVPWTPRRTLLASGSEDRHLVGESDDNGVLHLRFGDGTLGEPPEPGAILNACYRTGNGTVGNVPAEAITTLVSCTTRFDVVTRVRNPLPAQGGTDPEPSAAAQLYAPAMITEPLRRAITADDYAAIAAEDPGLQRAAAQLRWTGSWYEADVALDPVGTETLDASLARTVTRDLRHVRRLGHDLRVGPAEYVPLTIAMQICVLPDYQRAHVEAALLDLFGTGITASGQPGFFSPDNLTFGTPISVSGLVAAAASVTGVQSASVIKLQRLGQGDDGELAAGVLTTGPLQIPQLDNDPRHPERGVLQLTMGGGR
jgi:predicted phage baseplate assembly protein